MANDILLIGLITLPFAGSLAAALLPANARNLEAWLAGGVALAGLILTWACYTGVADGGVMQYRAQWLPLLGLDFVVRIDGFAWLFAVMITGIGLLVVLYARYYMSPQDPVPRFFSFFLAFMGAMLGIVLSGNLIQLVFFWELTGLFSFLLIGYWHHSAGPRDGARMALIVTASGGLCLLAGILILGHIVGSYDLDAVLASGSVIRSHSLYLPALILILLGALTKSAQFPFHFWLPQAMVAPTPVSAYLHSATLVKAGVFLLVRLWPVMAGTESWFWSVGMIGLLTFVLGAYLAIFQQDLKGLLAYSTISHLGLITLLLGLNTPLAAVAGVFHIINHATFKASLFMAAGIIDHESGTRDIRRLSGLYRFMPVTATLAMVAAAAMAGVPLLNGFLSKEMLFAETIAAHGGPVDRALPLIATLAGMFSVAYSLRFIHETFFGPPALALPRRPQEPPRWMRFPIDFLVLACLVVGIIPGRTIGPFLETAVRGVLGPALPEYDLAVWHGFTLPLLMSASALLGGAVVYRLLREYLARGIDGPPGLRRLKSRRLFDRSLVTVSWRWSASLQNYLGTRRLQVQLRLLMCTALLAACWPLFSRGLELVRSAPSAVDPVFALIWAVGATCALGGAYLAKYHRLAALILISGAGLVTSITFAWLSAPDLAMTQLLVEIVTTILILLGLRWLPQRRPGRDARSPIVTRARRAGDLAIATVAGLGLSLLAFTVMTRPAPPRVSDFFLAHAYTEGGGTNVVNVILVDFRGLDTLGEISVLGIVALAVYALLRRFRPASESIEIPAQQRVQNAHDATEPERSIGATAADYVAIPAVIVQWLSPFIALLAVFLLLRGHNLPGGGFVAGLTMAMALIVLYMSGGIRWVEARLRVRPVRWIGVGLVTALGTGVGSWLYAHPFLTSSTVHAELPIVGELPLASALVFDIGVFVLVVGAVGLILLAIAHQSIRSHRVPSPRVALPRPTAGEK